MHRVPPRSDGGGGRIRTFEGVSRQIYSLLPLAAREPLRSVSLSSASVLHVLPGAVRRLLQRSQQLRRAPPSSLWSWRRESNPRPSAYKAGALPAELRQPNRSIFLCCSGKKRHLSRAGRRLVGDLMRLVKLATVGDQAPIQTGRRRGPQRPGRRSN